MNSVAAIWTIWFRASALAAALCLVAGCTPGTPSRDLVEGAVLNLQVVKTLADLQRQPEMAIGQGSRVRLGVSAREAPVGQAVLVYCLWSGDGWDDWGWRRYLSGWPLGPLDLCWAAAPGYPRLLQTPAFHPSHKPFSPALAVAAVPVESASSRELLVRTRLGSRPDWTNLPRTVAQCTIRSTAEPSQTWHPLLPEGYSDLPPSAVPAMDGSQPVPLPARGGDALPGIVPDRESGMTIRVSQSQVLIEADREIRDRPDMFVMFRAWIDGRAVKTLGRDGVVEANGRVGYARKMRVDVRWDMLLPGLSDGCRVEVQCLYSPQGWQNGMCQIPWELLSGCWTDRLLSNRAEFVYRSSKAP